MKSRKSRVLLFFTLSLGYAACLIGISSVGSGSSTLSLTNSSFDNSVYEPLIAAISGGILTSGVFVFFLKRMLDQYDKRHDNHDKEIKTLYSNINELELTLNNKLYEKIDDLYQMLNEHLTVSTKAVIGNLDSLQESIRDLLEDFTVLKTEHNKCDYRSGDIKVLKSKIDNLNSLLKRFTEKV